MKTGPGTLTILMKVSCLLSGLLAGEDLYRYLVEVPAWKQLSIENWTAYSSHSDLGTGIFLFPVESVLCTSVLTASSVMVWKGHEKYRSMAWASYFSTFFSWIGLLFTFLTVPVMLRMFRIDDDIFAIKEAFFEFHRWGMKRTVAQFLCFLATIEAIGNMTKK